MLRPLSAAILSIALALPATTVPARANGEDVAKVLGGLAALYILKEALEDRRHQGTVTRHAPAHVAPAPRHQPRVHQPNRPRPDRARILPQQCLTNLTTSRGIVTGYGARCMQRWAARPNLLPTQCQRDVHTHRGWRRIYGARCMQRQGWTTRTARR